MHPVEQEEPGHRRAPPHRVGVREASPSGPAAGSGRSAARRAPGRRRCPGRTARPPERQGNAGPGRCARRRTAARPPPGWSGRRQWAASPAGRPTSARSVASDPSPGSSPRSSVTARWRATSPRSRAGSSVAEPGQLVLGAHLPDLVQDPLRRPADEDVLGDPDVVVDEGHQRVLRAACRVVVGEGGQVGGLVAVHVAVRPAAGEVDPAELTRPGGRLAAGTDPLGALGVRDERWRRPAGWWSPTRSGGGRWRRGTRSRIPVRRCRGRSPRSRRHCPAGHCRASRRRGRTPAWSRRVRRAAPRRRGSEAWPCSDPTPPEAAVQSGSDASAAGGVPPAPRRACA